jgi:hypothetical protein
VEGTADAVADHASTVAQVGPEVGAEGVEHHGLAVLTAIDHEFFAGVAHAAHLSGCELIGVCDPEPSKGHGEGEPFGHRIRISR